MLRAGSRLALVNLHQITLSVVNGIHKAAFKNILNNPYRQKITIKML